MFETLLGRCSRPAFAGINKEFKWHFLTHRNLLPLDIFLFITCMPAWIFGYIIGYLVSFFLPVSFPLMACIAQFFFYGVLSKIIRRGINFLKTQ